MTHRAETVVSRGRRPDGAYGQRGFYAACACQWRGQIRDTRADADEDARSHDETENGQ
jgi:hypothetical protein